MNSSCDTKETDISPRNLTIEESLLITLSVLTAISHIFGVAVLVRLRSQLNQNFIIINLAITEIIACLTYAALSMFQGIYYMFLIMVSGLAIRLLMMALVADRFLEIYLDIRYLITITKGRVFKFNCLVWVVSVAYGLSQSILTFVDSKSGFKIPVDQAYLIHNYILGIADAIFMILATSVYSYFYYKIRANNSKDSSQRKDKEHKARCNSAFNFRIPFVIVCTYLIFNVTSNVVFQLHRYRMEGVSDGHCTPYSLLLNLGCLLRLSGYLSDAFVYIFMQKNIQKLFKRRILPQTND